jgi:hypothetical protein
MVIPSGWALSDWIAFPASGMAFSGIHQAELELI